AQPTSGFEGLPENKGQTIKLTLTGGQDAGSYEVTTKDGACSYGIAEAASWGNQYSIATADPAAFSSLQLIAASVDPASGTNQFMTTVSFGELFSAAGRNYEIKALDGDEDGAGSGTVLVDDRGETATIRIQGQTAEGVGIDATIECLSVIRFDAPPGGGAPAGESAIALAISGGELAGEYAATLGGATSSCGAGAGNSSVLIEALAEGQRAASYTFEYLDEANGGPVHWIQLLAAEANGGPTQAFYLDIDDQTFYLENLAGGAGAGTVAVEDTGDSLVFALDVKNADGVSVTGSITCKNLAR
ncbi:MAG TPA: hypothetical protein VGE07_24425, partial [Herpetosiphonaceae bacterium]